MIRVETTSGCVRTPILLFALEETGTPYQVETMPDGHFDATYGEPGPRIVDGDTSGIGIPYLFATVARMAWPAGRHSDARFGAWARELATLRPVIARLGSAMRAGEAPPAEALETVLAFVGSLRDALATAPYVDGEAPGSSDAILMVAAPLARMGVKLPTEVQGWLGRMMARPALERARARAGA